MSITKLTSGRLSKVTLLILAVCLSAWAEQPSANDRLIAVGRLWATVKYFHPYLATGKVDWDKALIDNLPAIRSAKDAKSYSDAVEAMLDALHDPASYVEQQTGAAAQSGDGPVPGLEIPGERMWIHHGLPSYSGLHPELFYSAFASMAGVPSESGDRVAKQPPSAFVLNEGDTLSSAALALWHAGKASIDAKSHHFRIAGTQQVTIDLGEGVRANVRTSEPEFSDGTTFSDLHAKPAPMDPFPSVARDNDYANMPFPAAEYRILAAYKIWGAFRNFFAYRDLMDEDLDAVFAESIPKLLNAADAQAYHLAVAEAITHFDDTNSAAHSAILDDYFGQAPVPFRIALVEKRPLVTAAFPDALSAGVHVGDVILNVDGEDMIARIKREAEFVPASTQQSLRAQVLSRVLNGADGSTAILSVRDEDGTTKEVRLKRSMAYCRNGRDQRAGDPVRLLAGGIGYVDLDRLQPAQVDPMFETLKSAKAIIFDMRGTPHVTPESIASRLTDKTDVAAAIVTGPLGLAPDVSGAEKLTETSSFFLVQTFAPSPKPYFRGKTAMLIDERTNGEGERMGLFVEAANNTAFIGDTSAGAVAALTDFVVPGGIRVTVSGIDIRHGNAGKLQRLGLQTAVSVPATVSAIRSGRDEALEKAIAYLSQ